MDDKNDSSKKDNTKGKGVVISAYISVADAERIKQAFAEGKLKDLGLTDIKISPIEEHAPEKEDWAKGERRKRNKPRDDGTPPLP